MVTVLAVIVLMAGIMFPRYAALESGQQSRDFESALLRMGSDARLVAIEKGRIAQVRYDDELRAIVIESLDPDTGEATQERTFAVPTSADVTNYSVDGAFSDAASWLVQYFPDGTGQSCGIEVADGAYTYNVTINGLDGTATKTDGQLQESGQTEWQAGEIEQRV